MLVFYTIGFLVVFALSQGGRDQLLVAQFSDAIERTVGLLTLAFLCAGASTVLAAYVGHTIAPLLPPSMAQWLAVSALVFAAVDLLRPVKLKPMREPTRSYIAIGIVMFIRQLVDAPRLAVFGLALACGPGIGLALGEALGAGFAMALGWYAGLSRLAALPLSSIQAVLALALIVAAALIGFGGSSSEL